jgi:hypothetical protein
MTCAIMCNYTFARRREDAAFKFSLQGIKITCVKVVNEKEKIKTEGEENGRNN